MIRDDWRQGMQREAMRIGFGHGLVEAARVDERVVALSANLMESVGFGEFADYFGEPRTIDVGVAEQNLVTVASGLAAMGALPFAGSYAAFSPGRNWEQIRTTICLNNQPVKLLSSHAGLNVGPDGATHQMLEDIALMRVMPNMVVLAPGDSEEARQMALAMAADTRPNYVRLARLSTPCFLRTTFVIGRAYVLRRGQDVSLIGTGTMSYQLLWAADELAKHGIEAEVIHCPTIKPLDEATLLASAQKTGRVVTAEEAQIAGGFGSAVAELLSEHLPCPLLRIGIRDQFGESGTAEALWRAYHLDVSAITHQIRTFLAQQ